MNTANQTARRYHWHSKNGKALFWEPHSGISSQIKLESMLDLTAQSSTKNRQTSKDLVSSGSFNTLMKDLLLLSKYWTPFSQTAQIKDTSGQQRLKFLNL